MGIKEQEHEKGWTSWTQKAAARGAAAAKGVRLNVFVQCCSKCGPRIEARLANYSPLVTVEINTEFRRSLQKVAWCLDGVTFLSTETNNTKSWAYILYVFSFIFHFSSNLFLLYFTKLFQDALEIFKIRSFCV